jgi:hypothetical protein
MKVRICFLSTFFLFALSTSSQVPIFAFAKRFQNISSFDDSNEFISHIQLMPDSSISVCGFYYDQVSIGLQGESDFLSGSNDVISEGMYINYSNNDEIINSNILATILASSDRSMINDLSLVGYFSESTNFDQSEQSPFWADPINGSETCFIGSYSNNGELNWFWALNGSFSNSVSSNENTYFAGSCGENLLLQGITDTTSITSYELSNGVVVVFDSDGAISENHVFGSSDYDYLTGCDYSKSLQELAISGTTKGTLDFQWNGPSPYTVTNDLQAGFVSSYNGDYELSSILIFLNQNGSINDIVWCTDINYDLDGNLYISGIIEQGNYTFKLNDHEEDFIVTNPMELVMIKLSADKELQWIRRMPVDDASIINRIDIDHNGFINACGYYNTSISFEGTNVSYTDGGDYSGFIARWTPEGELVWAHTIYDSAGDNEIKDICITPQNYMYIGGYFTSFSTDFDFTEGQYDLGITNGEDAFLAKYTIANPTPDIFIEQGWQTTQVSESGTEDAIYIRLSHTPAAAVQVTATPDAQLDLGNGAGNSITLTFGADSTAIQQQTINVAAFNDTAVEGPHSGQINFSINSNDAAFDVLTEDAIIATITDNDVISVEENAALKFSVSPNPVKDELNIIFTQFQNNTNLNIYDEVGQMVLSTKANGTQQNINTSNLSSGRYSLVLIKGDSRSVVSFVKE